MSRPEATCLSWRTSSYSANGGDCVEIGWVPRAALVRDSKDIRGGRLAVGPSVWSDLLRSVSAA